MSTPEKPHPIDMETARLGYQAALNLASSYGETMWSMFNAMIVANSVLITGITFAQQVPPILRTLLPIAGLVLCITWLLQVMRTHGYVIYYRLSARELEENYLSEQLETMPRAREFGDGKEVTFKISEKNPRLRMRLLPRLIRIEWTSYAVIIIFVAVYCALFLQV